MLRLKFESSPVKTAGGDRLERTVSFYIDDHIGGNGEVNHGEPRGSIVLLSTSQYEGIIKMLRLKFESSPVKGHCHCQMSRSVNEQICFECAVIDTIYPLLYNTKLRTI